MASAGLKEAITRFASGPTNESGIFSLLASESLYHCPRKPVSLLLAPDVVRLKAVTKNSSRKLVIRSNGFRQCRKARPFIFKALTSVLLVGELADGLDHGGYSWLSRIGSLTFANNAFKSSTTEDSSATVFLNSFLPLNPKIGA